MDIIKIENIESKIITLREQKVILDSDVADLYGVATKRINEALKNNLDKFPDGYTWEVSETERDKLVENFDRFNLLKHSTVYPKAFTEKALYMLATILKSKIATQTTIAIIETFAKVKELTSTINELSTNPPKEKQQSLMQYNIVIARRNSQSRNIGNVAIFKNKQIISSYCPHNDVIVFNDLQTNESETTIELNFAVLKFKHTVKKEK